MTVLGIETSSAVCSVGLLHGDGTFHRSLSEDRIHAEQLLVLVRDVLAEAGVGPEAIGAVAVSEGPGSFTGLRIGASTAKGLAYALGVPLVPVATMTAMVRAARAAGVVDGPALVCIDARQGDWYVGVFDGTGQPVSVDVRTTDALRRTLTTDAVILTDKAGAFSDAGLRPLDASAYCRGDVVAVLGAEAFRAGRTADAAAFEPRYLKEFTVRTTPSGAARTP